MKPGTKWRIRVEIPGGDPLTMANVGTFDELCIDGWFHLEQMESRAWFLQVGDLCLSVGIDRLGNATVTEIERRKARIKVHP